MKIVRIWNETRQQPVAASIRVADSWWTRLRGMLGRPEPAEDEGMLLVPCRSVHMYWMKYPLDVAFLAADGRVVATYHGLAPSGRSKWHPDAEQALELRAGRLAASRTEIGDALVVHKQAERSDNG